MPEVSQIVQGTNPQRVLRFWIVTLGIGWNAELFFN